MVDLPLAAPVIMSGIRTATTICVGIATLSTFIGAGGLGDFVNRGLALNKIPLILLGAGAAAALALALDFIMGTVGILIRPGRKQQNIRRRTVASGLMLLGLIGVLTIPTGAARSVAGVKNPGVVRIGSKNFTEQFILGELMAQAIEKRTEIRVERIFNLGGTVICHEALENREIDLYPEYSGTSLAVVFGQESDEAWDDRAVYRHVKSLYEKEYGCTTIGPFGFNNTYRLTVSGTNAQKNGWKTVGDIREMAPQLVAGFTSEFIERSDGMNGLMNAYGLKFREIRDMSPELMYAAAANGDVDVICAFSTDGRIAAFDLTTLDDDLHYFPPYEAMPVVRMDLLDEHPEVGDVLRDLTASIDDSVMRSLNYRVDVEKISPRAVAESFLRDFLP
jgi:osmoprotectant transport system permease protein